MPANTYGFTHADVVLPRSLIVAADTLILHHATDNASGSRP
ncbi:hypothetical protein OH768_45735 [Streptomyces sp. NBC_01622]|nr:hypothetical protein OH768_45735 [Streptomyces sp. NBC_01622]